jgi:hypothetical protein
MAALPDKIWVFTVVSVTDGIEEPLVEEMRV